MMPNRVKQGQTGSNGAKRGQKGPYRAKLGQKGQTGHTRQNGADFLHARIFLGNQFGKCNTAKSFHSNIEGKANRTIFND